MNIEIQESEHIKGVLLVKLDAIFDRRGFNMEGYNQEKYAKAHPFFKKVKFPVDSFSHSKKGVLRGFHGDTKTHKFIQVLYGKIHFALIDKRVNGQNKIMNFTLDADNPMQILVPAGVVNAHLCLSDTCVFSYKLSEQYVDIKNQIHVSWKQNPFWNWSNPILSPRDSI
jgi:dTDP-4-dehydrorhamnose 3,5-epimerase